MIKCIKSERKEFFYEAIKVPINGEITYHICIFESGKSEVHPFTEYLTDKVGGFTLKNSSFNTLKNFHLTFIIRFLNYIFNDSKISISKIEDLKFELIDEFLNNYSKGKLSPNSNEWIDKKTVKRATYAISHFVYWLCCKKESGSSRRKFKMKFIKEKDFDFKKVTTHSKEGYVTKEKKVLDDIVIPITSSKNNIREKVVAPTDYLVRRLIDLSIENDPMLTFGIILGAYSGLRVGYIVQMSEERIKGLYKNKVEGAYFDCSSNEILRSDIKITGSMKIKIIVPIHPGFAEAIYNYLMLHIEYLKNQGLYPNKYGALFINNRGFAMDTQTYLRRFKKLNDLLDKAIKEEVLLGNKDAIQAEQILSENKLTPHSLRHYFKQTIKPIEKNRRMLQIYMGDTYIDSPELYSDGGSVKEKIRECQNKVYMPIKLNTLK